MLISTAEKPRRGTRIRSFSSSLSMGVILVHSCCLATCRRCARFGAAGECRRMPEWWRTDAVKPPRKREFGLAAAAWAAEREHPLSSCRISYRIRAPAWPLPQNCRASIRGNLPAEHHNALPVTSSDEDGAHHTPPLSQKRPTTAPAMQAALTHRPFSATCGL